MESFDELAVLEKIIKMADLRDFQGKDREDYIDKIFKKDKDAIRDNSWNLEEA